MKVAQVGGQEGIRISGIGVLHYCLVVKFERNIKALTITMNQRSYIEEILKRSKMKNINRSELCSMRIQNC